MRTRGRTCEFYAGRDQGRTHARSLARAHTQSYLAFLVASLRCLRYPHCPDPSKAAHHQRPPTSNLDIKWHWGMLQASPLRRSLEVSSPTCLPQALRCMLRSAAWRSPRRAPLRGCCAASPAVRPDPFAPCGAARRGERRPRIRLPRPYAPRRRRSLVHARLRPADGGSGCGPRPRFVALGLPTAVGGVRRGGRLVWRGNARRRGAACLHAFNWNQRRKTQSISTASRATTDTKTRDARELGRLDFYSVSSCASRTRLWPMATRREEAGSRWRSRASGFQGATPGPPRCRHGFARRAAAAGSRGLDAC